MSDNVVRIKRAQADGMLGAEQSALPLGEGEELHVLPPVEEAEEPAEIETGKVLALADFRAPDTSLLDTAKRWAYRLGVPGSVLAAPFRKPAAPRLLATVETPLPGDRAAGMALRAGHFLVYGLRAPIAQVDFGSASRLTPPFARYVHGFAWMRDLSTAAPRVQAAPVAERVMAGWLERNLAPGKGAAWSVELAGQRLLAWLVHAPLILSGESPKLRPMALDAIVSTARWLDRHVEKAEDRLGAVAGWCAITATGLLLPDGQPRRLYGEAGLLRALGEAMSDDGGVLSRSPMAQMDALALLVDLAACYRSVGEDPPAALDSIVTVLVPPLLALRHEDGGLGSWQGAHAVPAHRVADLVAASGVRTRPGKDMRQWGYQLVTASKAALQFDAAPPPRQRHARMGCASTLAFEFSHGAQRIIVNCGGAALAGALVPARIEQGLRGTSAHSTLVLDETNSTAVLIKGEIGKGVEEVDVTRTLIEQNGRKATRLEACHDGYASRFGLAHRRILILSADGTELRGEDGLEPSGRKLKHGKIGYAIRFHLGHGIEVRLAEDGRGAGLALPDGSYWQMRLGGDEGTLALEESLWVDHNGRPQPTQQLVIEGLASRSGGSFPWLLKKMG